MSIECIDFGEGWKADPNCLTNRGLHGASRTYVNRTSAVITVWDRHGIATVVPPMDEHALRTAEANEGNIYPDGHFTIYEYYQGYNKSQSVRVRNLPNGAENDRFVNLERRHRADHRSKLGRRPCTVTFDGRKGVEPTYHAKTVTDPNAPVPKQAFVEDRVARPTGKLIETSVDMEWLNAGRGEARYVYQSGIFIMANAPAGYRPQIYSREGTNLRLDDGRVGVTFEVFTRGTSSEHFYIPINGRVMELISRVCDDERSDAVEITWSHGFDQAPARKEIIPIKDMMATGAGQFRMYRNYREAVEAIDAELEQAKAEYELKLSALNESLADAQNEIVRLKSKVTFTEEEMKRVKTDLQRKQTLAEEELKRKHQLAEEEHSRKHLEAEQAIKKQKEIADLKYRQAEEALRKQTEEAARKQRLAEEELKRKHQLAEEDARRKQHHAEDALKKQKEEADRKQKQAEDALKRQQEEAARKQALAEESLERQRVAYREECDRKIRAAEDKARAAEIKAQDEIQKIKDSTAKARSQNVGFLTKTIMSVVDFFRWTAAFVF